MNYLFNLGVVDEMRNLPDHWRAHIFYRYVEQKQTYEIALYHNFKDKELRTDYEINEEDLAALSDDDAGRELVIRTRKATQQFLRDDWNKNHKGEYTGQ